MSFSKNVIFRVKDGQSVNFPEEKKIRRGRVAQSTKDLVDPVAAFLGSGISQPCLMTWEAILYDSVLANPLEIFPQKKKKNKNIKCLVYLPFCLAFDSDPCSNKKVSLDFNIPSSLLSSWSKHFLIPPICLELQVVMS